MTFEADETFRHALQLLQAGRVADAEQAFRQVLRAQPRHAGALNLLAVVIMQLGRLAEAEEFARQAAKESPTSDVTFYNYGLILRALGRPADALQRFSEALQINHSVPETWNNRGVTYNDLKRYADALADFDRALAIRGNYAEVLANKGRALAGLRQYEQALAACDAALALNPALPEAWIGRGNTCYELRRNRESLAAYDKAAAFKIDSPDLWLGRGNVYARLRQYDDALAAYDKALALRPGLAEAWLGRANVNFNLKQHGNAIAEYDKALQLNPDLTEAWIGRGSVFNNVKRHDQAASAYAEVLRSDPQFPFAKGLLLHQKMLGCDWRDVEELIAEIEKDIVAGKLAAEPFGWQGVANSQRSLQLCAELYNRHNFPVDTRAIQNRPPYLHDKIRIAYSSGEFRDQATSHLIVGLLESHDRSRFEVYGIDNGYDDQSEIRKRINASLHKLIDISQLGETAAAAVIRESEIDILVNLNGYFGEHRTDVFAQRPAPIQVNYLGFPGTLGAEYIDYIIADRHVIPADDAQFYTEKIVYLPNCYQANDRKRPIGTRPVDRVECKLPQDGFVFCCFNNSYKIVPEIFECWMRVLQRVDNSVLWLIEDNAIATSNLRQAAAARGVNPERLIFAARVPLADHLARHRLADLFLDTLPYNAHTTASDALWAGLPVLTQVGPTFAGRVAASLLYAIGLSELITSALQEYERLAIDLATNPKKLAAIQQKLFCNRLTTPLFDTLLFTRHIETAYMTMWERYQRGEPPAQFAVNAVERG